MYTVRAQVSLGTRVAQMREMLLAHQWVIGPVIEIEFPETVFFYSEHEYPHKFSAAQRVKNSAVTREVHSKIV